MPKMSAICRKHTKNGTTMRFMVKKTTLLFFSIFSFLCCSVKKDAHIAVYKRDWIGEVPPEYIILRIDDQIYDTYCGASGQYGQVGKYIIKNDTLYCIQNYSRLSSYVYFSNEDSTYIQKFLIKKIA